MADLISTLQISGAGMRAQSERVKIISQNIANADSTPNKAGEQPYSRKIVLFKSVMDKNLGDKLVAVDKIESDNKAEFGRKYMPGHPAADENGYVSTPNVSTLVESMDMREASRSYEASLGMFIQARDMANKTIDMLR